ncbi:MAG: hypothetical protein Q4E91_13170 [Lachnospiraceae bacterium]|nr:hypothetical protein [Lachnospiraceae bacterium]
MSIMRKIYRLCARLQGRLPGKTAGIFLVLNILFWCGLSLLLSAAGVLLFGGTLKGSEMTLFCIVGYTGFFIGFLGGALYLGKYE